MDRKELEIMAPAGGFDCLLAAAEGGADSVYFGVGKLNMRSHSAGNFTKEDLPEVMRLCRAYGMRGYLTLNITLYDEELNDARETLKMAKAAGVDAVIASDMAAILAARAEGLEVHISTQLSISNVEALKFYAQWADVVVLARELNLSQVKAIHEAIGRDHITGPSGQPVRIEMFAHGAFCMAVSGKCYLSLSAYGQSANRGECLQACRRGYLLTDYETGDAIHVDNKFLMSPKDLCTIGFLDRFVEAGVKVFKIEGRARSADYVKLTAEKYRKAADMVADGTYTPEKGEAMKADLATVFNRGFWDGYYLGAKMGEWSAVYGSQATRRKIYVGCVTNWYAKIDVVEVQVDAVPLPKGAELLFIGHKTGLLEVKADDLRVDLVQADMAPQGCRCSIAVPPEAQPEDKLNPGERIHPRKGDKVYIWSAL